MILMLFRKNSINWINYYKEHNIQKIIFFVVVLNIIFLFLYTFLLKDILLIIVQNNPDNIDRIYYSYIFNNLDKSVIIFSVLMFLLGIFMKFIKDLIIRVNNIKNVLIFCLFTVLSVQLIML